MARTRAEVRAFLDSQVGKMPQHPAPYQDLSGQCVTLTKVLMDFLGVPNPYAARGNARDAGDTYIRQGIGTSGRGWLTIVVNRDMGYIGGVRYGHIWIDLTNEANYESNGARALYTTKNTRPISQGQQYINFDKWIVEDNVSVDKLSKEDVIEIHRAYFIGDPGAGYGWEHVGQPLSKIVADWKNSGYRQNVLNRYWAFDQNQKTINDLNVQISQMNQAIQKLTSDDATDKARIEELQAIANNTQKVVDDLTAKNNELADEAAKMRGDYEKADSAGKAFLLWLGQQLSKLIPGGK